MRRYDTLPGGYGGHEGDAIVDEGERRSSRDVLPLGGRRAARDGTEEAQCRGAAGAHFTTRLVLVDHPLASRSLGREEEELGGLDG